MRFLAPQDLCQLAQARAHRRLPAHAPRSTVCAVGLPATRTCGGTTLSARCSAMPARARHGCAALTSGRLGWIGAAARPRVARRAQGRLPDLPPGTAACRIPPLTCLQRVTSLAGNWVKGRCDRDTIRCDGFGCYCFQYDDEKIVAGIRDNTIKARARSGRVMAHGAGVDNGATARAGEAVLRPPGLGAVSAVRRREDHLGLVGRHHPRLEPAHHRVSARAHRPPQGAPPARRRHIHARSRCCRSSSTPRISSPRPRTTPSSSGASPKCRASPVPAHSHAAQRNGVTAYTNQAVLRGHTAAVNSIDFNSEFIVSGSGDRTIRSAVLACAARLSGAGSGTWPTAPSSTCSPRTRAVRGRRAHCISCWVGIACVQIYQQFIASGSSDSVRRRPAAARHVRRWCSSGRSTQDSASGSWQVCLLHACGRGDAAQATRTWCAVCASRTSTSSPAPTTSPRSPARAAAHPTQNHPRVGLEDR